MDVVSFNPTNFIGLSSAYASDDTVTLNQSFFLTEQGYNLPLTEIYGNLQDTTTNNYSNLYLTRYDSLTSNVSIQSLDPLPVNGFSTYLATYNTPDIDNNTRFLVTEEPAITQSVANVALTGVSNNLDNRSFFEVLFLDDLFCKILHSYKGVNRYLTATDAFLSFQFDCQQDSLGPNSTQIFYYAYDQHSNVLILSKSLTDISGNNICEFVGYTPGPNPTLAFLKPVQGGNTPYPPTAAWLCMAKPGAKTDTLLYDAWVSYQRNFKTNTQDINVDRSIATVNSNLLVNSQYNNVVTDGQLNVNLLSLKNTNTPEGYQGRGNPFQANRSNYFTEDDASSRQYQKLFTGSNQLKGDDNISLGYQAYTSNLILPADKTTFFHTPQFLYPYVNINVANAGFIEAGAIAGDHPMKSDKIFKKLASAKYTSPFGTVSNETNGSFLCSWLSGSTNVITEPIWVDRYYNPSTISYIAALTGASVNYVTSFATLLSSVSSIIGNITVFDIPSQLTLEPGAYYAYQHIGNSYINQYIQSFNPYLVDNSFSAYLKTDDSNVLPAGLTANEFIFNGNQYTISNSLSTIDLSNQFTLSFYGNSTNWQKPLGYQLAGNFVHDGFGIFNTNNITPTLFVSGLTSLNILNTSLTPLKTINYTSTPLGFMRLEGMRDYYGIFNDGTFVRYDVADIPLISITNPLLEYAVSFDYTADTGYILCSSPTTTNILQADLINATLTDVTSTFNNIYYAPGCNIDTANTITYYNNSLYLTLGDQARLNNGFIYYLSPDYTSILKWDTTLLQVTTAFKSYSAFADYNFDFNNNIWILDSQKNYYAYSSSRALLLSGSFSPNSTQIIPFNFVGDGITTTFTLTGNGYSLNPSDYSLNYQYTTTLSAISSIINSQGVIIAANIYSLDTVQYSGTYKPNLDYTIGNNQIIFNTAPGLGYNISGNTTISIDTYSNNTINILNDITPTGLSQTVVVARNGYNPNTSLSGYQINVIALTGGVISNTIVDTPVNFNFDSTTNDNYIQNYVHAVYGDANLNVKAVLTNVYNSADTLTTEIITSLSGLDPGPHHFAVRFDSYHGEMTLFIDGQEVGNTYFQPRKYKFSNLIKRPFMFGTATFKNNVPLFKYLKNKNYLVNNLTITNYNLYNTSLNDFDIMSLTRQGMMIQDLVVDIPCGRRNYVEEIERYFKATVPGSKSTLYNLNIINTGITDPSLQQALQTRILTELNNTAPVYSQINKINWIN